MANRRPLILLVALASALAALPAQAQDDTYRHLAEEAARAVAERRLDEAFTLFREMHAAQPSARTLWSMGRVRYEQERYVDALTYLEEALEDPRRPLDGSARTEAESLRDRALALIAVVEIEVDPAGATLLVDDAVAQGPTLRLDPGEHRLRVEHRGHEPALRRLVLRSGERQAMSIALEPLASRGGGSEITAVGNLNLGAMMGTSLGGPAQLTLSGLPGMTLHLQRYSMGGTPGPVGEPEAVCTAPCEGSVTPGLYRAGVERPGGGIAYMLHPLNVIGDSELRLDYVDNTGARLGGGITSIITALLGAAGTVLGAMMIDSGNTDLYDIGWGIALLSLGPTVGALGLTGLIFFAMDDEADVRVLSH